MCRKCDECRKEWRRKWLGRLNAEAHTATATWFVTLTYGGGYDNARAYDLDRRDIAQFYKRLRNRGYKFKPVGVGEYGGKKNRAHWHVIIFWEGDPPKVPMDQRFDWTWRDAKGVERPIWEWGFAQCEYPRSKQACASYILKYLDKPVEQRGDFSFPKHPALGERFLQEQAKEKARKGLPLFPAKTPTYQVPGNVKNTGKSKGLPYDYWLDPKSVLFDRMIATYCEEWLLRQNKPIPACQFVAAWAERIPGSERGEIKDDAARLTCRVIDRARIEGWEVRGKLEWHSTSEEDVALFKAPAYGVGEWQESEDSGRTITWRKSVNLRENPDPNRPPDLRGQPLERLPEPLEHGRWNCRSPAASLSWTRRRQIWSTVRPEDRPFHTPVTDEK
jgi:hypothetical protein